MNKTFKKTGDAGTNAVAPISFAAAALARDAFKDGLDNVKAPDDKHKVIPEITVSITYRIEKKA